MSKYKLEMQENKFKNTLEFEADGLGDVIANIEIFLKGNGFFFDGVLDIHTDEAQTNSMHAVSYRHTTDKDFDDVMTDSDELDMEIKEWLFIRLLVYFLKEEKDTSKDEYQIKIKDGMINFINVEDKVTGGRI